MITGMIRKVIENVRLCMTDDAKRIRLQFIWVYWVLASVSVFMTVVNFFTEKRLLMLSTFIFGIMCLINIALSRFGEKAMYLSKWLFCIEFLLLLSFFVVSGTPEGFSAIWACFIPASGLLLFKRRSGTILSAIMFAILVFFFETPLGNSFLQYDYTASFKLRFPMLYVAFFAVSFILETIRSLTFDEMKKAQEKYEYLYRHDALTGVCNRYGFNEKTSSLLKDTSQKSLALLVLDLDHFKRVNDAYGHPFGDEVLKRVASIILEKSGDSADVCRWGGEEFATLLCIDKSSDVKSDMNSYSLKTAKAILSALRDTAYKTPNGEIHITASIGIAVAETGAGIELSSLIRTADACLYEAKEKGRDTLVCKHVYADEPIKCDAKQA